MQILSSSQIRKVEEKAVEHGAEYLALMETAGSACAENISNAHKVSSGADVAVVCGKGKNGGDGFVIARKLCEAGASVTVVLGCGEPQADDAVTMFEKLSNLPVKVISYLEAASEAVEKIKSADFLIDAVFGIGFKGEPGLLLSGLFEDMNSSEAYKISIDVPSGVNCDCDELSRRAFRTDETLAISCLKKCHVMMPAAGYCGNVSIIDIGISESCFEEAGWDLEKIDDEDISPLFPKRNSVSNKGDFGRALCVCGSKNMVGAAVLSAKGAVHAGAGLVTVCFPDKAYAGIASKLTEPLMLPVYSNKHGFFSQSALPEILSAAEKAGSILVGCGMGDCPDTEFILLELLKKVKCPVVLDADGINIISRHMDVLKEVKAPLVLTPHPGEMARLLNCSAGEVQSSRVEIAKSFTELYGNLTLVLKGANTLVAAKNEKIYVNVTGNPGMAKGGSGDLLAGMLVSFLAQGMKPFEAARAAVYLHGKAGDSAARKYSQRAMTPTNMIEFFPEVFKPFD